MVTDSPPKVPRTTVLPWFFSIASLVTAVLGPPVGVVAALRHLHEGLHCRSTWPGLVGASFVVLITPSIISTVLAFAGLIAARTGRRPSPVPVVTTVALVLAGSVLVLVAGGGGVLGLAMTLLWHGQRC